MIDDISLPVILFMGENMLHIIEAFDMSGVKNTFYVDCKDPVGFVKSCADTDGLKLREVTVVGQVESWEGRLGAWHTTSMPRDSLGFCRELEALRRHITVNPRLVHEALDGPCTFVRSEGETVFVIDGGRPRELRYDPVDGGFELILG